MECPDRSMSNPGDPQSLTKRQIAWWRENIKSFSEARRAVQNAGVEPGAIPCHAA
jgi:hypothetical protein